MAKKRKLTGGDGWSLEPDSESVSRPAQAPAPGKGLRVRLEKRPRGKVVSVVEGLPADPEMLQGMLAGLKKACGGGGTLRPDGFELQGDHVTTIRNSLVAAGHRLRA